MERNSSGEVRVKIRAEYVIEAATLAAGGQPYEIVYYPCASTHRSFCVKASLLELQCKFSDAQE
ncbi:hypothetical protein Pyn_02532 [Prunus yedoensis var. nudiflora]|uniref:Uncharacterized protein n=1 Tax=Prunus yedoensis var. nudiflora TaxID=2094558 RepID=A0A314YV77_PRUYE|nr:hypothetical protein Pyn_02532 [Prunus yedoensis var. nudiflora]